MIPLPIILIHGFNGAPSNWTGPSDRFPEYLAGYGFDPDLIRVFDYGHSDNNGKPVYDNLEDIRQIAHRLDVEEGPSAHDCSVDRLSAESLARGGPAKVTLIAHSSGGLVGRYYLTRQTEDEFGTRYRGNVGRVIFLGTPHHGVDVEDMLDPLPTNLLVYRLMIRAHYLFPPQYHEQENALRAELRELRRVTKSALTQEARSETPAFYQMHPGSPFLQDINRPGLMPRDIEYHNIIGDVRAHIRAEILGRTVLNAEKSFGDFLVTAGSSGSIPNAFSRCYPIIQEYSLQVEIGRRISRLVRADEKGEGPIPIHRHLRSLPASREWIIEILSRSEARRRESPVPGFETSSASS